MRNPKTVKVKEKPKTEEDLKIEEVSKEKVVLEEITEKAMILYEVPVNLMERITEHCKNLKPYNISITNFKTRAFKIGVALLLREDAEDIIEELKLEGKNNGKIRNRD